MGRMEDTGQTSINESHKYAIGVRGQASLIPHYLDVSEHQRDLPHRGLHLCSPR